MASLVRRPVGELARARRISRDSQDNSGQEADDQDELPQDDQVNKDGEQEQGKRGLKQLVAPYVPVLGCLGILVVAIIFYFFYRTETAFEEQKLMTAIKNIRNLFPAQSNELWASILSVLAHVGKRETECPNSILIIIRGDKRSQDTSSCLISKVSNTSASILPFRARKPLTLRGSDLDCDDCTSKQREKVQEHGMVVVEHLENFPLRSAEALHFFCDEYDSSFPKAAYFLKMTINGNPTQATKATAVAETALQNLWPQMKSESRKALIARLTSHVVLIEPEDTIPC